MLLKLNEFNKTVMFMAYERMSNSILAGGLDGKVIAMCLDGPFE